MDVVKVALFAVLSAVLVCLVRQTKSDFAVAVAVVSGVVLVSLVCDNLFEVVYAFYDLSESAGVDHAAVNCVIRVVGIGYVAEFACGICNDAGCKSIGDKVLLASKVAIILVALPVVQNLFEAIKGLLS